jgi:hypothetical protein
MRKELHQQRSVGTAVVTVQGSRVTTQYWYLVNNACERLWYTCNGTDLKPARITRQLPVQLALAHPCPVRVQMPVPWTFRALSGDPHGLAQQSTQRELPGHVHRCGNFRGTLSRFVQDAKGATSQRKVRALSTRSPPDFYRSDT